MTDATSQHPSRGPIDPQRLAEAFAATPGLTLEVLADADSTNRIAAERARAGSPEGLVVVADHQTAGRGRLDRTWESPAGTAATFSLLLRPTVPAAQWPWLPLLVGHTVAKALVSLGYKSQVKWPNDILLGGTAGADDQDGAEGKVAGILVERVDTPSGPAAVVGVGINVGLTEDELPVPTATSLWLADPAETPTREAVVVAAVLALQEGYDVWQAGGAAATERLAESYRAACATIGRAVRVELPGGGELVGTAVDIDEAGRLVVDTGERREPVGAGDVVHVRASS